MRRLLFCSGNRMLAFDWSGGRFGNAACFTPDDDGYRDFQRYLLDVPRRPVTLLVDLIEEEFHADSVPFVRGRDRKAVLDRALAKYFRTSELRTVRLQGRERGGRKDQQICVCGLGSATILKRWLAIIAHNRIALRGVVSLPLAGELLLPLIKADKQRVLLVSQQSPETLRQSFYDNGHLKLSRLAHHRSELISSDSDGRPRVDVPHVLADIRNTLLFLRSQRLLQRNEHVELCLIGKREVYAPLEAEMAGDESVNCRIIDSAELAHKAGLRGELPTAYCEGLFGQLVCKHRDLTNHYAPWRMRRHFAHTLARRGLWVASAAILLGATGLTGHNLYNASLYTDYALQARTEVSRYRQVLSEQTEESTRFNLPPDAIKSTVKLVSGLEAHGRASPLRLLGDLAAVVDQHPHVDIHSLQWQTHFDDSITPGSRALSSRAEMQQQAERQNNDREGGEFEIARVDGGMIGFGDNYRQSVELFHDFVAALRKSGRYSRVLVEKTPFDMDPGAGISGDSGDSGAIELRSRATFSLLLARPVVGAADGAEQADDNGATGNT